MILQTKLFGCKRSYSCLNPLILKSLDNVFNYPAIYLSFNLWPVFMVSFPASSYITGTFSLEELVCKYCVIMKIWSESFLGWLSDLLFAKRQHE